MAERTFGPNLGISLLLPLIANLLSVCVLFVNGIQFFFLGLGLVLGSFNLDKFGKR